MDLSLSNIINISVSQSPAGISAYNTSNIALFTDDTPGEDFPAEGYAIYLEPSAVAKDFGTDSVTYAMALKVFGQQPNILANNGYLVIIAFATDETLDAAITRTIDLVAYFGIMSTRIEAEADMLAAGAVIQAQNCIGFFVQRAAGSIEPGGSLDKLRSGSLTQSRGLYYGVADDNAALEMQAAYASRALSTVFSGSNTTQTMQLKQLVGVQPDPSITQTIFNKAKNAGADVYASFEGQPAVYSSGENEFFDNVYNLQWFVGALQVAGFNYLLQASTKIPQTENGMDGLKAAYRAVTEQAVSNQYVAPNKWTSPTTFGNQADMLANIEQFGYYIYSLPIAKQLQVDRADRKAPLVQIAIKVAGAIHSSNVVVFVND